MEYTVKALGDLAGISPRTIRFYDEIGLLKPAKINFSGYRVYSVSEVDRLQQILFYRELGFELQQIKDILGSPGFDTLSALRAHKENLLQKREQIDRLLQNVDKTIQKEEGVYEMSDHEKFEGLKKQFIQENDSKYGSEIREKYGADAVEKSNEKFKGMSQEAYEAMERLSKEILADLKTAVQSHQDPAGQEGLKIAEKHKQWLSYTWGEYSKEAHKNLGRMYVEDERFTQYYDREVQGCAAFLNEALSNYTK